MEKGAEGGFFVCQEAMKEARPSGRQRPSTVRCIIFKAFQVPVVERQRERGVREREGGGREREREREKKKDAEEIFLHSDAHLLSFLCCSFGGRRRRSEGGRGRVWAAGRSGKGAAEGLTEAGGRVEARKRNEEGREAKSRACGAAEGEKSAKEEEAATRGKRGGVRGAREGKEGLRGEKRKLQPLRGGKRE